MGVKERVRNTLQCLNPYFCYSINKSKNTSSLRKTNWRSHVRGCLGGGAPPVYFRRSLGWRRLCMYDCACMMVLCLMSSRYEICCISNVCAMPFSMAVRVLCSTYTSMLCSSAVCVPSRMLPLYSRRSAHWICIAVCCKFIHFSLQRTTPIGSEKCELPGIAALVCQLFLAPLHNKPSR